MCRVSAESMMRRTQADSVVDVQCERPVEPLWQNVVRLSVGVLAAYHATVAVPVAHRSRPLCELALERRLPCRMMSRMMSRMPCRMMRRVRCALWHGRRGFVHGHVVLILLIFWT